MFRAMANSLPNAISLSRLVLGLIFPWLPPGWRLPAVVAAAITDGLDGQASRLMGAESALGQHLDPIADKVFFLAVVATLLYEGSLGPWEMLGIGLRDFTVILGGSWVTLTEGFTSWGKLKVRWSGKIATVLQFLFILAVLFETESMRSPLLVATVLASAWASWDYVKAYMDGGPNYTARGLN